MCHGSVEDPFSQIWSQIVIVPNYQKYHDSIWPANILVYYVTIDMWLSSIVTLWNFCNKILYEIIIQIISKCTILFINRLKLSQNSEYSHDNVLKSGVSIGHGHNTSQSSGIIIKSSLWSSSCWCPVAVIFLSCIKPAIAKWYCRDMQN